MKNCLDLMVCLSKQNWAALFLNCSKNSHSSESFTYLFDQNYSIPLLTANKNSSADPLKLGVIGYFGLILILFELNVIIDKL